MQLYGKNRLKQNKTTAVLPAVIVAVPLSVFYYLYTDAPIVSVLFGSFLACAAAFYAMGNLKNREAFILLGVFGVKYLLTTYQALNKNLPLGGEDWGNYHRDAQILVASGGGDIFKILFGERFDLFTRICAVLYEIFGIHTRQIYLYVLATSFVAVNYVYQTVDLMTDGDAHASSLASLAFAVWPIDIIYSVTYLREMPIQMLVILSFYRFIRFMKTRKIGSFILAFAYIAVACMMHSGVITLAFIYIVFFSLRQTDSIKKVFRIQYLIPVVVAIAVLMVSPIGKSMFAKIGDVSSIDAVVERAGQFNEDIANTKYISELPESAVQFIVQMPYRAVLFALVPLPWMIINFNTGLSWVLDALPQFWILYRTAGLLKITRKNKRYRLFVIMFISCLIGTYVVCGMGTTAYGNAIRHRAKILPIVLAFIIGLYTHIKNEKREQYGRFRNNSGV